VQRCSKNALPLHHSCCHVGLQGSEPRRHQPLHPVLCCHLQLLGLAAALLQV
jgi:hypothetical protein